MLHRRFGRTRVRPIGGRLSGGTVIGIVVRNNRPLLFVEGAGATILDQRRNHISCKIRDHLAKTKLNPLTSNQRGVTARSKNKREAPILAKRVEESKPTSKHTVLNHFSKDPNRETCGMSSTMGARCQNRPETRNDGIPPREMLKTLSQRILKFEEGW